MRRNDMKQKQRATEIEWLKWFFDHADFGPADSDVREWIAESFKIKTGKLLPVGYSDDEE
jgi:hypothetical protein